MHNKNMNTLFLPVRQEVKKLYAAQLTWFGEVFLPLWFEENFPKEKPVVYIDDNNDLVELTREWNPHCEIVIETHFHALRITYGQLDWSTDGRLHIPTDNALDELSSYYQGRLLDIGHYAMAIFPRVFPKRFGTAVEKEWIRYVRYKNENPLCMYGHAFDTTEILKENE